MDLSEISAATIAKRLASCKQSSRNRSLLLLSKWLPKQTSNLSDAELLNIWKGLFFCVWHSDKQSNQIDLINRLANLLSSLPPQLAARYFSSFLTTIRREWSGIDLLRLDKFYLLIRRLIRHLFVFLRNNAWDLGLAGGLVETLLSVERFHAAGVNYHVVEVLLDEVVEFLPLGEEVVGLLLEPFVSVLRSCADKVLVGKIKVCIFDRLAANGSSLLADLEAGGEVEKLGKIALAMGFSKRFFGLASDAETLQGNRKVLFGLHDLYAKLEKDVENLALVVSLKQLGNGGSAPECACDVVPIKKKKKKADEVLDENGTNGKIKKKRKKKKMVSLGSSTESNGEKQEKKLVDSSADSNGVEATIRDSERIGNNVNGNLDSSDDNEMICFDDTLLSNLQKQFAKAAAEAGMAKVSKKRKWAINTDNKQDFLNSENVDKVSETEKNVEMSGKKVKFSMNKNLIWKPQNPLPPQNLRLPPSVTPRGSALKKGLSPGPIRESPPTVKKIKVKGSSLKKGRKTVSPAVKRFRLMHGFSA